jgi:hypothetical protein
MSQHQVDEFIAQMEESVHEAKRIHAMDVVVKGTTTHG